MPISSYNQIPTSIKFLYFSGPNGIKIPNETTRKIVVVPGNYTCHFSYSGSLNQNYVWVKKIETLETSSPTWVLNPQEDKIEVDFTSGVSTWVTLGLTSHIAEYVTGSKNSPPIVSDTILFQVDPKFLFVPASAPVPSASNESIPSLISGLKLPVIPIIFGTPTPTPSIKPQLPYNPVVSTYTFSTTLDSVSPILDSHQLSYTTVKNIINEYADETVIESESGSSGGVTVARYITKPVKLLEDNLAAGFFISFAANIPEEASVYLFHKILNTVEDQSLSTFESQPWIYTGTSGTRKSLDKKEFLDFEFSLDSISYPSNTSITQFDMFAIKIVMTSSNPSKVPKIKDFRVMAHS